ncbi:MAG: SLC13 family permease, partial [Longimicrobiales bacterium]
MNTDPADTGSVLEAATESEHAPAEFRWPADRPSPAPEALPRMAPASPARRLRMAVAGAGILLATVVYLIPAPIGLAVEGKAAFAVFLACITLWITNALPIGVTGLLAVALLALTGGLEPAEAYAAFGNSAVFFILGVFIFAAGIIHSGLSKRLALAFLRRFQRGPYTLAAGMMVTAAFLTVWMPAQATAAMLFPITVEIARAAKLRQGASAYGKVLFLAAAWGAMIGSNASMLGSARAPLALGLLEEGFGTTIGFADWIAASGPVVVLGLLVGLVVLRLGFRTEPVELGAARRVIAHGVVELGPMGPRQARVAIIMVATIAAWILLGDVVDRAAVALLAAAAMFALGVLRWNDLEGYVPWGIVLMYGGAIAAGVAIDRTGAAEWLVSGLLDGTQLPPYVTIVGLALMMVALSEVMSNAAAVAVLLPLAFSLAGPLGLTPTALVLTTCIGAGLAFTLPISSAPNTIAYSSGYVG